jgi:predicted SnoaL-like aldol condensation-catalyzing enzyme
MFHELSAEEAAARPIAGAHSAWEIALHIGYWHAVVRRRLAGEVVVYKPDEDWPPPAAATDADWPGTLDDLDRAHQALVAAVRLLTPDKLSQKVPGREFTVYFMLNGVPQHDLYHGGQVMFLIKAMRAGSGSADLKEAATTFLRLVAAGDVREAYRRYVGPGFRHHNAYFPGDAESLMAAMEENAAKNPNKVLGIQRALQDGDLVAVHSRIRQGPADSGAAVVHIFRFEGSLIAELWDIGQSAPADSPNQYGMF